MDGVHWTVWIGTGYDNFDKQLSSEESTDWVGVKQETGTNFQDEGHDYLRYFGQIDS